jgi:hypothetical protein
MGGCRWKADGGGLQGDRVTRGGALAPVVGMKRMVDVALQGCGIAVALDGVARGRADHRDAG